VGWCVRELEPCIRSEIKPFTNGMFHQIDTLGIKETEWRQDGLLIDGFAEKKIRDSGVWTEKRTDEVWEMITTGDVYVQKSSERLLEALKSKDIKTLVEKSTKLTIWAIVREKWSDARRKIFKREQWPDLTEKRGSRSLGIETPESESEQPPKKRQKKSSLEY